MKSPVLDKYYIVKNGKIKEVLITFDKYCELIHKINIYYYYRDAKERSIMDKKKLFNLQNHFDSGIKDGYQASRKYKVNDRVHLKGTVCNGIIQSVVFREDRTYPYLKIKWDIKVPIENVKTWYDPFDVVPEVKQKQKKSKTKKEYHNDYLEMINARKMDT